MAPRMKAVIQKKKRKTIDDSSPPSREPPHRFSHPDNSKWYETHKNNKFVIEVTPTESIEQKFHLRSIFHRMHWEGLLQLKGVYYPELVKEFYSNLAHKTQLSHTVLYSSIRGREVMIDQESIEQLLRFPPATRVLNWNESAPVDHESWRSNSVASDFGLFYDNTSSSRKRWLTGDLAFGPRLACYIFSRNLQPQSSGYNEVRLIDLYLLDVLFNGLGDREPIRISNIILNSIGLVVRHRISTKTFVFPVLISQLLTRQGVDVTPFYGIDSATSPDNLLDDRKMSLIGYTWNKDLDRYENDRREDKGYPLRPGNEAEERIRRRASQAHQPEEEEVGPSTRPQGDPGAGPSTSRRRSSGYSMQGISERLDELQLEVHTMRDDFTTRLQSHEERMDQHHQESQATLASIGDQMSMMWQYMQQHFPPPQ